MSSLIPEGTYTACAVAADVQWGHTSGGKEQIVVPFRILDGEARGRVITWFGFFTDKTWERTMQSLRYAGWTGDDVANLGDLPNQVEIVIGHEEYDGKTRAKIQWVNQIGGGKIQLNNPMADGALRKFAAAMRSRAKGVNEVAGVPASEFKSNGATPFDDGDPGPSPEDDWS
jgi:hypothetical protein